MAIECRRRRWTALTRFINQVDLASDNIAADIAQLIGGYSVQWPQGFTPATYVTGSVLDWMSILGGVEKC